MDGSWEAVVACSNEILLDEIKAYRKDVVPFVGVRVRRLFAARGCSAPIISMPIFTVDNEPLHEELYCGINRLSLSVIVVYPSFDASGNIMASASCHLLYAVARSSRWPLVDHAIRAHDLAEHGAIRFAEGNDTLRNAEPVSV